MMASGKEILVTYKNLKPNQKCIYDAFKLALQIEGRVLADFVNSKGISADDGEAVIVLARKYGFKCEGAFTGEFARNPINYRPEADSHLIYVITTESETVGAQAMRSQFQSSKSLGDSDATRPLSDKRFTDVQWHAIYAKSNSHNQVIQWIDRQGQRNSGPLVGDFCVIFSKPL
jgi:hypothetical protein